MQLITESKWKRSSLWRHNNRLSNHDFYQHKPTTALNINETVSNDMMTTANEFSTFFIQSVEDLAAVTLRQGK